MARIYRRGRIWWLRWYFKGKLYHRSLKTVNRRVALYHKAQKEKELSVGKHASGEGLPFAEAASRYLEATKPLKVPQTHQVDSWHVQIFSESLGRTKLEALTPATIETCINAIAAKRHLREKTRNHYLKLLRTMSRWCVNRGLLAEDFTKGVKLLKVPERPRTWLTKDQRDKLLALAADSPLLPDVDDCALCRAAVAGTHHAGMAGFGF